jgi:hypothetical protein
MTIIACPLLSWMKSSAAVGDSCHVHSSSPLPASDQVQRSGYSKSEVETDVTALELETDAVGLKLETSTAGLELETSATDLELEMYTTGLELEMNAGALKLDTDTAALDLEIETNVPYEILKQERHSTDLEWSTLKLLLMGQHQ